MKDDGHITTRYDVSEQRERKAFVEGLNEARRQYQIQVAAMERQYRAQIVVLERRLASYEQGGERCL